MAVAIFHLSGILFNLQFPKQLPLFLMTEQDLPGVRKGRFPGQADKLLMSFIQHYRMQE
jgi:hypothetical protein